MAALPPAQAKADKAAKKKAAERKAAKKKAEAKKAAVKAAAAGATLFQDTGKAVAEGEYRPQMTAVQDEIRGIKQQVKPGGQFDQAFGNYQGAINQATQFLAQSAGDAQQRQLDATKSAGNALGQLGAEQVAQANERMRIYGQTAAAAQAPAGVMGAAATSLQQRMLGPAAQLGQEQVIAADTGAHLTAAQTYRRAEAREKLHQERVTQSSKLNELRGKRSTRATELAQDYQSNYDKNKLARAALNQKSKAADRDYKISLANIRLQADRNRITEAFNNGKLSNEQRANQMKAANDRYNAITGRKNADTAATKVAGDIADDKFDNAHPNQNGGSGGSSGSPGRGQRSMVVGRNGKTINVSNTDFNTAMDRYRDLKHATAGIRQALKGGASDPEKIRKRLGVKDHEMFELAMGIVKRGRAKYTIERRHLPYLRALFPGGHLPKDIADRVIPK